LPAAFTTCSARQTFRYRLLGDPVVRAALQHLLQHNLESNNRLLPVGECRAVLEYALEHIERGRDVPPAVSGMSPLPIGRAPHLGWIWTEDHADDVIGRAFRSLVHQEYGEPLSTPSAEEVTQLREAVELLDHLVPTLARSALSHVQIVALYPPLGNWRGKGSTSQYRFSRIVFLNRERIASVT
jgi:hypothetical protein